MHNIYGSSETGMITFSWTNAHLGQLFPNVEMKIVDLETGERLGPNKEGELCIKSPTVMKGYLGNVNK